MAKLQQIEIRKTRARATPKSPRNLSKFQADEPVNLVGGQGHYFRASLPITALSVTAEPDVMTGTTIQDDIRMFVLSFLASFMGISLFIW